MKKNIKMKQHLNLLLIIPILCLFSCQPEVDSELLKGNWKAIEMIEEGKTTNLADRDVSFNFYDNGTYLYDSNNSYKEAGPYRIKGQMLYTIDTIAEGRLEKSVKIALLAADSLTFDMNRNGVPQTLKLVRR